MKRAPINCFALLLLLATPAVAKWARLPLEELLKETDLIVIARLTNVTEVSTNGVDYGSGTLAVSEVIRGSAKTGDKLRLEWSNNSGIICPRVNHTQHQSKTMIWLLQASTNNTVSADYPGRVLDPKSRVELEALLKKK